MFYPPSTNHSCTKGTITRGLFRRCSYHDLPVDFAFVMNEQGGGALCGGIRSECLLQQPDDDLKDSIVAVLDDDSIWLPL